MISYLLFSGERGPGEVRAGSCTAERAADRAGQGGGQASDILHRRLQQGPRPRRFGTDRGTRDFQDCVVMLSLSL